MSADFRYSIEIRWSETDEHYLARVAELPGCIADGTTVEETFQNIIIVAKQWLETASELGREIPSPVTIEADYQRTKDMSEEFSKNIEVAINQQVKDALEKAKKQEEEATFRGRAMQPHLIFMEGGRQQRGTLFTFAEGL